MKKLAILLAFIHLTGLSPLVSTSAISGKPPLYLFMIGHIEPCMSDQTYRAQTEDLAWFKSTCKKYGVKITALFNGSYPERAIKLGNTKVFKDLQSSGHEVGTHAHPYIRTGEFSWKEVGGMVNRNSPKFSMEIADRVWKDNRVWVDKVIDPKSNQTSCDSAYKWSNEGGFAKKYGYANTAGQRNEYAISYTGYLAPHPFRPARIDDPKRVLDEDFTQSFVMFDHYPQLGEPNAHSFFDCTLPKTIADFEKRYNEWKNASGDEAGKVWIFGVLHHPGTVAFRDQVEGFLKHVKENYLGRKQADGRPELVWETVSGIRKAFDVWEKANPGKSSWKHVPADPPPWGGAGSVSIRNGGFEDGFRNFRSFWESRGAVDSEKSRTGKHSLKLVALKNPISLSQSLNAGRKQYILSVYLKGDPKVSLVLQATLAKDGSPVKKNVISPKFVASADWKQLTLAIDAREWNLASVGLVFGGIGTVYADDFALSENPSTKPSVNLPKIRIMIVSHNEEPGGKSVNAMDFLGDSKAYLSNRRLMVRLCKMLKENGASYNFQSDWNFLMAVEKFDTGNVTLDTNGKNLVKWIKEDMGFSVDAHAHETKYNYADVAYLITKLGIEPSPVVGGFIYDPPKDEAWSKLIPGLKGRIYPQHFWKPDILWGAATFLHKGNDERSSGCWRPKGISSFTTHDDAQRQIFVGSNMPGIQGIRILAKEIGDSTAPADGFYTASYFIGQGQIGDEHLSKISMDIDEMNILVKSGRAVWSTVQNAASDWLVEHRGKPSRHSVKH